MLLIPSVTLQDGRVVGIDGKPQGAKPEDLAARLADAGISRLQLIDEASHISERASILATLERIATRLDGIDLIVSTGVKEEDEVQSHLDAGAHWLVLGHRAASAPHVLKDLCLEYPGHILIGMNVRDGHMAGDAHSKLSNHELVDLAEHFQSDGVSGIVYQDVDENGRPVEPDEKIVREISDAINVELILAGHIDSMQSLEKACGLADIAAVIVNAANGLDFSEARKRVEEQD